MVTETMDLSLLLFRFSSRSATATPTGSPKKRQLPQIPAALKERVTQDFEERARFMRHRNRPSIYRSTGMGGEVQSFLGKFNVSPIFLFLYCTLKKYIKIQTYFNIVANVTYSCNKILYKNTIIYRYINLLF